MGDTNEQKPLSSKPTEESSKSSIVCPNTEGKTVGGNLFGTPKCFKNQGGFVGAGMINTATPPARIISPNIRNLADNSSKKLIFSLTPEFSDTDLRKKALRFNQNATISTI